LVILLASLSSSLPARAQTTVEAEILVPPKPEYPRFALWFGWEGYCEVRFAIDEEGHPFAVEPSCTLRNFCFQAKRSIIDAKFKPKMVDGVAVVRTKMYYPLEFVIAGSDYDSQFDPRPLKPCEERAVS
jgi:outer membrane biosynthesis protein TonB